MIDEMIRRTVLLESLKSHYEKDFEPFIKKLDEMLRLSLSDAELSQMSAKQLDKWISKNKAQIIKLLDGYADVLLDNADALIADELSFTAKTVIAVTGASVVVPKMVSYLDVPLPSGALVNEVLKKFGENESDRIISAIRRGIFEGKTNQQIVQIVRGTRKNRFNDGIIATTTRHANAITRTLIAHSATEARMAFGKANSEIVGDKVRIIATLDGRTSSICRAKDWQVFPFERQYLPPFHINCRSSWVFAINDIKNRASKDGVVQAKSYYEWLQTQSHDFQNSVLGKSRAQMFRSGELSAEKFRQLQLDKNFKPRTLQEIQDILERQ